MKFILRLSTLFLLIIFLFPNRYTCNGQNYSTPIYLNKADSLLIQVERSDSNIISNLLAIAEIYLFESTEKSIEFGLRAAELAEKNDSLKQLGSAFGLLGEAYFYVDNFEQSLKYFLNELKIWKQLELANEISRAFNNLGIVYRNIGDYENAINYYSKSIAIKKALNDTISVSATLNNIGVLYFIQKKYHSALNYYKQSLELEKQIKYDEGIATSYLNIGEVYHYLGQDLLALDYYNKCETLASKIGDKLTLEYLYEAYYNLYKKQKNYEGALTSLEKYTKIKEERFNQEYESNIAELEIKYETEKKQRELELLNKDKELSDLLIQKKNQETKRQRLFIALILFIVLILSGFLYYMVLQNKVRRKNNNILRQKNEEILQQKEEIEAQRDEIKTKSQEIEAQRDMATEQRDFIASQNNKITDSIQYAEKIQNALLPDTEALNKTFPEHFILHKPKDIVSGDFYFLKHIEDKTIFAVADCTGHGVPGAFMSILGISALNEILTNTANLQADHLLDQLRDYIKTALKQTGNVNDSHDGMDISLCIIDKEEGSLQFAGSYHSLYIIRDGKLNVYKGDKTPISFHYKESEFTSKLIDIRPNDTFYLFTDGFIDQVGGDDKKKFLLSNFKNLLLETSGFPLNMQKNFIIAALENWQKDYEQIDDILVVGFKIF